MPPFYLLTILLLSHVVANGASKQSSTAKLQSTRVCYPPYGCYTSTGIFAHMKVLPKSPKQIDTTFWLFAPGREKPEQLHFPRLGQTKLNTTDELYILVHGFGDFPPWITPMKEELLKKNITVIIVDWTKGSHAPNYYQAASNTRVVGAVVAELINNLLNNTYFDMKDITIVGFSLGAHVCGFAGKKLGKLNHIIALDPAGPLFSGHVPEVRLAPTDADFVECIHTDGKAFIHGGLGTMEPMGHVDFYPNGGMTQLGCPKNAKEIILDLWYLNSSTLATLTCSHSRAPMLFTESIRNAGQEDHCNFSAVTCDSAEHWEMGRCLKCQKASSSPTFGFRLSQSTAPRGQFFFATRNHNDDDTPFCGKQYGIALNPDRWVKGNLWFFVRYKDGSQEIVDLLTGSEELRADNSTVKVVAMARPIDEESTISLLYKRYTSWIWTNGPQQWELRSFSIVESSCTFTHIESTVKIVDQMLTEIKLTR